MTDEKVLRNYARLLEAEADLAKLKTQYPRKDFTSLARLHKQCKTATLAGDADSVIALIILIQEEGYSMGIPGLFTQTKSDC